MAYFSVWVVSGVHLLAYTWIDSKSLSSHIGNVSGNGIVARCILALGFMGCVPCLCADHTSSLATYGSSMDFSGDCFLEGGLMGSADGIFGIDQ